MPIAAPPAVESRDTLRHSLVDGSLQVLVNIMVQRQLPWGTVKSRLARALHNVLVTWLLTESHSAAPTPYIWRKWCVGVRDHCHHHNHSMPLSSSMQDWSYRRTRYQQFFGYLDDLRFYLSGHHFRARRKSKALLE
jgi:hypothetical protein